MVNPKDTTIFVIQSAIPGNEIYWQEIKPYEGGVNGIMVFPEGWVVSFDYGPSPKMTGAFRSMVDRNVAEPLDKTRWRMVFADLTEPNATSPFNPNVGYDINEIVRDTNLADGVTKYYRCRLRTYVLNSLPESKGVEHGTLELSKHYALAYKDPWGDYDVKNVKINAITDQESSVLYSKDSIFSEFYGAYDISLGQFIKDMGAVPDMYICTTIESLDPIGYGSDVVIPKAIIDVDNCEPLLICDKFSVSISPIISHSELAFERGEIIQDLNKSIRLKLREVREIGEMPIDVSISPSDILMPEKEYHQIEDARLDNIRLIERSAAASAARRLEELRAMNREVNRLETEVRDNRDQKRILAHLIRRFSVLTIGLQNSFANFTNAWKTLNDKIWADETIMQSDIDPIDSFIADINRNTAYGASTLEELEVMVSNVVREFMGQSSLTALATALRDRYYSLINQSNPPITEDIAHFIDDLIGQQIRDFARLLIQANVSLVPAETLEYTRSTSAKGDVTGIDDEE